MATILIIEDDATIQALLTEKLTAEGFDVRHAYSGTEGQMAFTQAKPDLILLDLMLPGMTGEELLSDIRQQSEVPVIAITAKADVASKVALLTSGADDYITKPFDMDEVIARVNLQLQHHQQTGGVRYGDVVLAPDERSVRVSDQVINLTAHEFDILRLLMAQPKKVFSRANIYESVWHEPYFEADKTVNVHVNNLRRKLNAMGNDYIKTIWGVGFKFD
ncbi:response regulator transcription factor [Weissella confusa]|uniref:response regulator transcription factor n=1 Tax=Weissella confusa TaxID=1583 RepID=UPI0035A321DE